MNCSKLQYCIYIYLLDAFVHNDEERQIMPQHLFYPKGLDILCVMFTSTIEITNYLQFQNVTYDSKSCCLILVNLTTS